MLTIAKIFVIITKGKDDLNMVNVAYSVAYNAVKNAKATVSFMFLGRGVENLLKDSNGVKPIIDLIESMKSENIDVSYCKVSLAGIGLKPDEIIEGVEPVMGAVQMAKKIDEGYSVITF